MEQVHFSDRRSAGEALAAPLARFRGEMPIVIGLTRGGIAVAEPIARILKAPLDMLVVHKIGAPGQPELGVGALAEGDVQVIDTVLCEHLGIADAQIRSLTQAHAASLDARIGRYRQDFPRIDLHGRMVVIIDDGLATGSTAHAAIRSARRAGAERVILAVPVGSLSAIHRLKAVADEVICLNAPEDFRAVGAHYDDFPQLTDRDMLELLTGGTRVDVGIPVGDTVLKAVMDVPSGAQVLVVFAHGSGSSRLSPRNHRVARILHDAGLATLLVDLLTEDEAQERSHVFDVEHLADRLEAIIGWTRTYRRTQHLKVTLFGASTGSAAALSVAARCPELISSVVSRGGRPDLARHWLPLVEAPTLLIVGGDDVDVLRLNREAKSHMTCLVSLAIIPNAGHLFEEAGALESVAMLARDWFARLSVAHAA